MLRSKEFTLLFFGGAILASVGDWFHMHTGTTSYPCEVYGWYIAGIPFFIPPLFGLAAVFLGILYEQSRRLFGVDRFRESAGVIHLIGAALVYMVLHALSGYICQWGFPVTDILLALPVGLTWYFVDRSSGGALFCLFAGLIGANAEILLVRKEIFSFSDKSFRTFGVASWLPWIYVAGALAISRFLEKGGRPHGTSTGATSHLLEKPEHRSHRLSQE